MSNIVPTRATGEFTLMRGLVQRVSRARVTVSGEEVGGIGAGVCLFVGISHDDTETEADRLAHKVFGLRIMADDQGRMNRAVADAGGRVLVVSQFTLYGDTSRGRRPSWLAAAPGEVAEPLVDRVAESLTSLGATVAVGSFGADMAVELVNDGPVTLWLEVGPAGTAGA